MNRGIQTSLALTIAVMLAGCEPSAEERLGRAEEALAAHDYATARFDLVGVLQDQPDNARVMRMLARTYLALGDPVAAMGILDRMSAGGKPAPDVPLLYGEAEVMLGRFDAALARVEGRPEAEAFRIRALAHVGRGEGEAAQAAYAAGLAAPGDKARLHADYAASLLEQGDLARARDFATKAAALPTKPLNAYLVNADIAQADSRPKAALEWYEKALAAYPGNRVALLAKIGVLDRLGHTAQIRPLVAQALQETPDDADFVYLDARLAAADGDWRKVRERLQPREAALKEDPGAALLYARALLKTGQPEQARVLLLSQLLREPGDREVRVALGEARLATGDVAGAVQTLSPLASLEDLSAHERKVLASTAKAAGLESLVAS